LFTRTGRMRRDTSNIANGLRQRSRKIPAPKDPVLSKRWYETACPPVENLTISATGRIGNVAAHLSAKLDRAVPAQWVHPLN